METRSVRAEAAFDSEVPEQVPPICVLASCSLCSLRGWGWDQGVCLPGSGGTQWLPTSELLYKSQAVASAESLGTVAKGPCSSSPGTCLRCYQQAVDTWLSVGLKLTGSHHWRPPGFTGVTPAGICAWTHHQVKSGALRKGMASEMEQKTLTLQQGTLRAVSSPTHGLCFEVQCEGVSLAPDTVCSVPKAHALGS